MSRRSKRILFVVAAVLLGLLVGLIAGEVAVRVCGLRPERYPPPQWLVLHEGSFKDAGKWGGGALKRESRFADRGVRMGEYVPGATCKVVYATNPRGYFDDDNGVMIKINSLGLRGPEIDRVKPPGVFRVLGLGDSFTFGVGLREEHTFLRRLEHSLNANPLTPGQRYEVLNAGTQGYNTRDEVLYLEHRWLELDPDLILVNFFINDAYSDAAFFYMRQALGIYVEPAEWARYSRLLDLVVHSLHVRKIRRAVEEYYRSHYFSDPEHSLDQGAGARMDWRLSRAALGRAKQLADERGIKIALVIFPELQDLDGNYPFEAIHRLVAETAESMAMPVLDLLEVLRGRKDRDLWVHRSDHHPNEIASELIAEAIDDFLRRHDLATTQVQPGS